MGRNIIICCDGTGNEFGISKTNVLRLVQVLERDPSKQLLYYDPGVGTMPEPGLLSKTASMISVLHGMAFGGGLAWKVEQAYVYLMTNWKPGDRVFLFGFSRGAYTVRVLAGMLHALGLLADSNTNQVRYAMRLFKAIRNKDFSGEQSPKYWALCDEFRQTFAQPTGIVDGAQSGEADDNERRFKVHFVGVWDTVSTVGFVWNPQSFQYTANNPSVSIMRHALSLDERRFFFRQNLFGKGKESQNIDLKELWFPGVHSDVGGGYPESEGRLWRVAFEWMLDEARDKGLIVNEQRLQEVLRKTTPPEFPWAERKHESLTLPWWIIEVFCPKLIKSPKYRWRVPRLGLGSYRKISKGALISKAALLRIRDDKLAYNPPSLNSKFLDKVRQMETVPDSLPYEY